MFSQENYWQIYFSHWDNIEQKDIDALNERLEHTGIEVKVQVETDEDWVTFRFIP